MNRWFSTLVTIVLITVPVVRGQESHVETRYYKDTNRTVLTSDLIYVINSPSQFMQIQLVGRFAGQGKPTQLPDKLNLQFYSFTRDPVYQTDTNHRLRAKVDDQVFDFGLLTYAKLDGKGKDEKEKTNPNPVGGNLGVEFSIPDAAVITKVVNRSLLTAEIMSTRGLAVSDLRTLAAGKDVVLRVGDTVFRLTPVHLAILREFAEAIAPANLTSDTGPAEDSPINSDVPSDQNNTSLADTLKWLKNRLGADSATKDVALSRRFEPIDFRTCRISYRAVPLIDHLRNSDTLIYSIMEYEVNLADLNPEAIDVSGVMDFAHLSMRTRDYQPKIKVYTHANLGGTMGRTLKDALTESTMISLRNITAAREFKAGLIHAINLCQTQSQK